MFKTKRLRTAQLLCQLLFVSPLLLTSAFAGSPQDDEAKTQNRASAQPACSDRTFKGDYGFAVEGNILPAPAITLTIRGLQLIHANGKGVLTAVEHLIIDGQGPTEDWAAISGTYHVNANCTGTAYLSNTTLGTFVNLRMVVVKDGREVHMLVTPPYDSGGVPRSVASTGKRVDDTQ